MMQTSHRLVLLAGCIHWQSQADLCREALKHVTEHVTEHQLEKDQLMEGRVS